MHLDPKAIEAARKATALQFPGAWLDEMCLTFLRAYLSASIPAGLDAVDMDMIQRGDRLGPELGARVGSALLSLSARVGELERERDTWKERAGINIERHRAEAKLAGGAVWRVNVNESDGRTYLWFTRGDGLSTALSCATYNASGETIASQVVKEYVAALTHTNGAVTEASIPRSVSDAELSQWAEKRADDAGRLARELLAYRRASLRGEAS